MVLQRRRHRGCQSGPTKANGGNNVFSSYARHSGACVPARSVCALRRVYVHTARSRALLQHGVGKALTAAHQVLLAKSSRHTNTLC